MTVPHSARVRGCILGGAIADAIGYQVEFDSLDKILWARPLGVTGPVPGQQLLASDDTQMTLFTMRGLAACAGTSVTHGDQVEAVRLELVSWLHTQTGRPAEQGSLASIELLRRRRAPGHTCMSALSAGGLGTTAIPINDSKGCGAVMRAAPVGLLPFLSAQDAYDLGCSTGALTHGHVDGWAPAGAMASITNMLCAGISMVEAATAAVDMLPAACGTRRLLLEALRLHADGEVLEGQSLTNTLGYGWVGDEALSVGLYAVLVSRSFEDAVRLSATHSGDSDSTASICGQLMGARDGLSCVPPHGSRAWTLLPYATRNARGS